MLFALPAGAVIWLIANIPVGDRVLAQWLIAATGSGRLVIGLNGVILLAYIVAIPANEIVIPTVLMLTVLDARVVGRGRRGRRDVRAGVGYRNRQLLRPGGWTLLTGINLMLFSLLHNPCSTTIYTIWKETGSIRWTLVATLLPLLLGVAVCFFVAQCWYLLAG